MGENPPTRLIGMALGTLIFLSGGGLFAQTWRSELYPENWQRPDEAVSFYDDKLIQDFSYAGYKSGTEAIPSAAVTHNAVTGYGADPTGTNDSTAAIQNAINAAQSGGGGVVYLPAGTYKVSIQSGKTYCLAITKSNVVLRGAGSASTFLLNTETVMSGKSVLSILPSPAKTTGSAVNITADLPGPTRRIPVATPNSFAVGDIVRIEWSFTDAWVAEHSQQTYWNATKGYPAAAEYLRQVTAVNQAGGWIEVDVPTRYAIFTRDAALVRKLSGLLAGSGAEGLSIGNVENSGTGWGESDYTVGGTGAAEVHAAYLVKLYDVYDCWVSDVKSYQAPGNTTTCHMPSNGISVNSCFRVTVKDCWMGRPQYGGGGGNGYMYRLQNSNDCLLQSCTSDLARHGFVISHAGTSGNVFLQCDDRNTGRAMGSSSTPYTTNGSGSDNHMHFSHSNLWDRCIAYDSYYTASHRGTSGTVPHGLSSAHAIYWNTTGEGTRYNDIVKSNQGRYGYVIGTSGTKFGVNSTVSNGTAPEDHVEGVGTGGTLLPVSLYQDQLERRLRPVVTYNGNGSTGGTVPTDGNNPYTPGSTATVLGAGSMVRTNYTFTGWNTQADGMGTNYAASSTFAIDNHLTLYAQWQGTSVTVNFDANGGDTASPTSKTVNLGDPYGTLATTNRAGYSFLGWFTAASGGSEVTSTTQVTNSATHTLYAQWAVIRTAAPASIDGIVGLAQSEASQPGYYVNRNSGLVGGTGSATTQTRYSMVPVVGFTLPTLPPGHAVESVTLHYQITGYRYQTDPNFTADVYLLNSADPSGTGTGLYYMGAADPNPNTQLIGSTDLPDGVTGTSITADPAIEVSHPLTGTALTNFLAFYSGNAPTQAEAFVRFNRSSADNPDLANSQVYERFYIDTNPTNLSLEITTSGPSSYTISYDGNGQTGGEAPSAQTKTLGLDLTLSTNSGTLVKTGYTFVGWNTAADGSGTNYAAGASYSAEGDVTLYARWQSAFEAWALANGTGSETFGGDSNGDGIADGLAWLLDSASPASPAGHLLPTSQHSTGALITQFRMLKASARGTALLKLQYSRDLGISDLWADHTILVPDSDGTVGGVDFVITPNAGEDYHDVQATVPASAAAGGPGLFLRLLAEE